MEDGGPYAKHLPSFVREGQCKGELLLRFILQGNAAVSLASARRGFTEKKQD
jgi:hypothetical protein